jgi:hypothetical protein
MVVVHFTTSPTKLILHFPEFSTIFYVFSKIQKHDFTIWDSNFQRGPWNILEHTTMPLVRVKHSRKKEGDTIGSLAMEGGAAHRNLAAPPAPLAGEVEGEGVGLTRVRFVYSVRGEGLPAGVDGDSKWRPPLERLLRQVERCRLRAGTLRGFCVVVGRGP